MIRFNRLDLAGECHGWPWRLLLAALVVLWVACCHADQIIDERASLSHLRANGCVLANSDGSEIEIGIDQADAVLTIVAARSGPGDLWHCDDGTEFYRP